MSNVFKKSKKGAEPSAGSSAIMLVIIAGVIIFYLLMVSPTERAKLLNDSSSSGGTGGNSGATFTEQEMLLQENIGRLTKMPFSEKNHELSALSINTKTNAQVVADVSSLYVRNSVFTKKFPEINFRMDPDLSANVKLSFNVVKANGVLMVYLNGHEVFAGDIKYTSPPAIELPEDILDDNNNLVFYLYRPTWAIWRIGEYELRNVNILADITDISNDAATVDFAISDIEYDNIDEARFYFLPECTVSEVGKLTIFLNNRRIYSAIPDCGIQNHLILDTYELDPGKNTVSFKTESGEYLLDQLRVKTILKDTVYPVYYFDLDDKYFFEGEDEDDEEDYTYFCDESISNSNNNGRTILFEYDGDVIETGWECDDNEDCFGNFRRYTEEKSESMVTNRLCEELDEDDFKYFCATDDESILMKNERDVEDTGWECTGGRTCEGNSELYDREKLEAIVKEELCYYDDDNTPIYYGDAQFKEKYDVTVTLRFPDNNYKELTVWVNGYRKHVSTREHAYDFNIDAYLYPGSNAVEIVPESSDIRVTELKIELEEND